MNQLKIHIHSIILILAVTGSALFGQSRQDIEMIKKLAAEQKKDLVEEATTTIEEPEELTPTVSKVDLPEEKPKTEHYGYNFFSAPKTIELLNNLPVPSDYILGPGDEIVLTLWGETELRTSHEISRDNTIYVERVGLLSLSGKTVREAERYLKGQLEKAYATLKAPNARTFLDISIGKLKSINVRFVGEVSIPGLYPVHPFSTVTTGLMQAGGVLKTGSLRDIKLTRDGKTAATVDMYAFLQQGKTDGDIRLKDQDVVFVPVRHSALSIDGEINRPGVYELLPKESLADLVKYSAGLKANARSKIGLKRIRPRNVRETEDNPLETYYIENEYLSDWIIHDGDEVTVYDLLPETSEIEVLGQVKSPGTYVFFEGMRLLDALKLAGGFEDDNFWKSVYPTDGLILRRNTEGLYSVEIKFSPEKLRDGDQSQNLVLENGDQVILKHSSFFRPHEQVTVAGEVNIPGVYPLAHDDVPFADIIAKAGGYTDRAFAEGMLITRAEERVVISDGIDRFPLRPGDQIFIPRAPHTVKVTGEVYNPGILSYNRKMSLADYIEAAGGMTEDARKKHISVIYPTGDVKIKKRFGGSPKVTEGSTIVIHRKKETEPFDLTEFLKDASSIMASLVTILYITRGL